MNSIVWCQYRTADRACSGDIWQEFEKKSIIHENKEIINESALTEKLKRELPVRITTPHNNIHEFNAVVSISFQTTRNGNGSYVITLTDDGE